MCARWWAGRVDKERLYLSDVYGFARLAIQTGAPLVPVYTFGESLSMGPDWVLFLRRAEKTVLPGKRTDSVRVAVPAVVRAVPERTARDGGGRAHRPRTDRPPPSRARVKALHTAYVDALLRMIERTKREAGTRRRRQ